MTRQLTDPEIGEITVRKNPRAKRITIRVSPRKGVTLTLPWLTSYKQGMETLLEQKGWILTTLERQRRKLREHPMPTKEEIERMRVLAKEILPPRLEELAREHSFQYNQVRIKNNVSNWGSCSRKGNINLNLNLVRLPEDLRDYVMLHELCHLKHPNHGPGFHSLLESVCPEHRKKEKELRKFRIF